ncbi:MAG: sensor domain-containing diguanylate cyclase [Candidatus Kapaibacteriota bacterium]|jgi:transcriptional regulator with GAF, ATPase, and Fis domain
MGVENSFKILKKLGIKGLVLAACVFVGLVLILIVPTFPMKLLGIGIVILSMIGLILSFYQSGYVTGKVDIVEERKPSTPLPKNLKIDEIKTDKGKIKSFENVETELPIEIGTERSSTKSAKKRFGLLQGFINFVAKSEEKPYFPPKKKEMQKQIETPATTQMDLSSETSEFDGSFKILRKGKSISKREPSGEDSSVQPKTEVSVLDEAEKVGYEGMHSDKLTIEAKEEFSALDSNEAPAGVHTEKTEERVDKQDAIKVNFEPGYQNRSLKIETRDFDIDANLVKGEPIKEMKILFERLLNVIGTVSKATTSAFYLVNRLKGELVLQAIVSQVPNSLRKDRKIPLDGDLVSQIVSKGKAQIIDFNSSASELDLLPYYNKPVGAKTFIGVPLKLKGNIIGVLCADSIAPEAFDDYTMNFFLHYSSIFSFFLESYTEKYELLLESRIVELIDELKKSYFTNVAKSKESFKNILQSIQKLFDFNTVGLCLYDFDSKFYRVFYIFSRNNIEQELKNKRVDLKRTLLGKALTERRTVLAEFDEQTKRVHYLEAKLKKGNFVAVPIKTNLGVYGAIFGWTDELNPVVNHTIRLLENLAFTFGLFYENDYLHFLNRGSSKEETKVEENVFVKKIDEEWKRAIEFGIPFSVCKIAIDNYLMDTNLVEEFYVKSKSAVLDNLKKLTKDFDFVCELEDKTIGAVFVGRTGKDTKLLLEMLRKNVAQTNLRINNDNIFFTVSIGVAQFSKDISVYKLIENVDKALEISCSRKNTVTLY